MAKTTNPAAVKAAKAEAKAARKAASKQRRAQLWQAFQIQRKEDKRLLPYMIGAFVLIVALAVAMAAYSGGIFRWITLLVREHLTLSEFATGRNPNDPNVGDDLAGRLDHNPVLLDMLFDLTRADGSSLGATSGETISKQYGWSKWRETLVRTMYNATRYHM